MAKLFLTCPIFYVNARPHLGHAYTLCLADAWARYAALRGDPSLSAFYSPVKASSSKLALSIKNKLLLSAKSQPVSAFLSCGTDEHGSKSLGDEMSVECHDFVRTSQTRHTLAVQEFWKRLASTDHLYQATYAGWYSVTDEAFLSDWPKTDSAKDGRPFGNSFSTTGIDPSSPAGGGGGNIEWVEESNFMFRLTAFREELHKWLDSGVFCTPSQLSDGKRVNSSQGQWLELAHDMVDKARDVSVSRPAARVDWAVKVPGHSDHTIYVWLDALVSYLTVTGFPWTIPASLSTQLPTWPPDIQFFGKDILKFHAVLWPALLMAVDLPLPERLICHSHLLVDGHKMSKSLGNVLSPSTERDLLAPSSSSSCLDQADYEGLRYALLRLPLLRSDASYSRQLAQQVINTELVNSIGNLLSR